MGNSVLLIGKLAALGLWAVIVVNLVRPFPEPYEGIFHGVGILLLVAHVLEFAMFNAVIREKSTNLAADAVQVLLFGMFHIKTVQARGTS